MNSNEIYYRIWVPREAGESPEVCAVQWFDEHDYDATRWLKDSDGEPRKFETEEEAAAYLPALLVLSAYGIQDTRNISQNFRDAEALGYPKITARRRKETTMTAPRKTTVPAGAKKPADRQTAKDDVVGKITEFDWRGTTYAVDPEKMDDLEFFEALEGNQFAGALRRMLGDQQYDRFKNQVKEAEGRVSLKTTQTFLEEYMEFANRGN